MTIRDEMMTLYKIALLAGLYEAAEEILKKYIALA